MGTHTAYKLLVILGTRPETIKLSAVIHNAQAHEAFDVVVCNTGQHKQLTDEALTVLDISADHDLAVMEDEQTLEGLTSKLMVGISRVIKQESPDLVIVQGDTTSALVGAMAAFYSQCAVAHVEAGLRTSDKHLPFPEEMNRRLISQIADLHFCPTSLNVDNLKQLGITATTLTGNTGIDALIATQERISNNALTISSEVTQVCNKEELVLITLHRREHIGAQLNEVLTAIEHLTKSLPSIYFAFILHPNPKFKQVITNRLEGNLAVKLLDPVKYQDIIYLMSQCKLLLTDSGGLQEEATFLGVPTLVLRANTERPEAITNGLSLLTPPDAPAITAKVTDILADPTSYKALAAPSNIYGDGTASIKIINVIAAYLRGHKQ